MSKPKTYFVRVKPYHKRRGYLVHNYVHRGQRFTTRWTEVSRIVAEQLEVVTQPHDPESEIPVFDVVTRDVALEIEEKERDEQGRPSSRVKDAEKVPDAKFRETASHVNDDGEIETHVSEPDDSESHEASSTDPAPAPKIRARARKRD